MTHLLRQSFVRTNVDNASFVGISQHQLHRVETDVRLPASRGCRDKCRCISEQQK